MKLHEIVNAIRNAKSKADKTNILREHADNEHLRRLLICTYDPQVRNGVTHVKTETSGAASLEDVMDALGDALLLSGDAQEQRLVAIASTLTAEDQALLNGMFYGNLKLGIGVGVFNQVIGEGFIFDKDANYMRCSLPTDKILASFNFARAIVQPKLDGAYYELHSFGLRTRAGNVLPLSATPFQAMMGFALMGEMVCVRDGSILPREEGNGLLNALTQGTPLPNDVTLAYHVWDVKGSGMETKPYEERLEALTKIVETLKNPNITVVPSVRVTTFAEAKAYAIEQIRAGGEGAILKSLDMLYTPGTSKEQIKLKVECDCELRVVELVEANVGSRHAATFGSLKCQSEDGLLQVDVSGIHDEERAAIAANPKAYIGRIATVTFNNIMEPTEDKETYSLFLPRFKKEAKTIMWRDDKSEADTLEHIQATFSSQTS